MDQEDVPCCSKDINTDKLDSTDQKVLKNDEPNSKKGVFECVKCGLKENYEYYGKDPPFANVLTFNEPCYMLRDPFSKPDLNQALILGSNCSQCNQQVCKSMVCSIYYCKTYCLNCAKLVCDTFPQTIQNKIQKFL